MKRVGWTMSVLLALFMLAGSAAPKLLGAQAAADAMAPLGWPLDKLLFIGVVELVGTVLFLMPRTALWGALALRDDAVRKLFAVSRRDEEVPHHD